MLCLRTLGPALVASVLLAVVDAAVPLSATAQQPSPPVAPDAGVLDAAPGDAALPPPPPAAAPGVGAAPVVVPPVEGAAVPENAAPEVEPPRLQRCVVIDAAPYGIDPIVGRYVSQTMRATAQELGYSVLTPDESVAAAQAVRMSYPPAPADLWRATWAARAARGAFARVWAYRGQYVVELTVASADGGGPFYARGFATAQELVATVARLTREALPPPGVSTAPQVRPPPGTQLPGTQIAVSSEAPQQPSTPPRRRRHGHTRRWVFAVRTDLAFHLSHDFFVNALLGARVDYRLTPDIRLGAYLGYANLRGKDGRAGNFLVLAQVEDRVRISSGTDVRVPLRLALGYLPKNGPVVRLAAGLGFLVSRRVELTFDILAPTFWVASDRTIVTLDLGVELGYRF